MNSVIKYRILFLEYRKGKLEISNSLDLGENTKKAKYITEQIKMKFWEDEIIWPNEELLLCIARVRNPGAKESTDSIAAIGGYSFKMRDKINKFIKTL